MNVVRGALTLASIVSFGAGAAWGAGVGTLTLTPVPGQPNRFVVRSAFTGSTCPAFNQSSGGCNYNEAQVEFSIFPCPIGGGCSAGDPYYRYLRPPFSIPIPYGAALLDTVRLHPDSSYTLSGSWYTEAGEDQVGCFVVCSDGGSTGSLRFPARAVAVVPQSAAQEITPTGAGYDIALRSTTLPQGLALELQFDPAFACPAQSIRTARLKPRSGTGSVTPLRFVGTSSGLLRYSGYFAIDNFTAPGYYDLEVICNDGSSRVLATNIRYRGYIGYVASGSIRNQLTGNVIRGAGVSLWRDIGGGAYNLVAGQTAGDGTYFFDVAPGTYKILVQYELAGQQWRGPFTVTGPQPAPGSKSGEAILSTIPFEETLVTPVTADTTPPSFALQPVGPRSVNARWTDGGVGLSVVEVVPGSQQNVVVSIDPHALGAVSAGIGVSLADTTAPGAVTLRAIDQLGNRAQQAVQIVPTTGAALVEIPPGHVVLRRIASAAGAGRARFELILDRPGELAVEVFDLRGARLRVLTRGTRTAGAHVLEWNGNDDAGAPVASGVYFVRATCGHESATLHTVLLR